MPAGGRPYPGRKPSTDRARTALPAIAATAVVAVLAVVVVVLAYRVGHSHNGPSVGDFAELEARLDELAGQVNGIQATAQHAARTAQTALKRAGKTAGTSQQAQLRVCLTQMQREIDDLQAYLAYRTPPRRDRVTGDCLKLLQPRFQGSG